VPQDGGGRLTSRLEPARSKGRRQAGVRLRLADELGHDLAGAPEKASMRSGAVREVEATSPVSTKSSV